jgi:hypothetical protein
MSDILEYLTTNSRVNYPFKDSCTLAQVISTRAPLPIDAFLDFQLVAYDQPINRAVLKKLIAFRSEVDPVIMLDIVGLYADGSRHTFSFVVPFPTAAQQVSTVTSDGAFFRFITGDSIPAMLHGTAYALPSDFDSVCTAEFCSSTIINPVAQVISTTFKNYDGAEIYSFGIADIVNLKAQANITGTQINDSSFYLDVLKDSGSGLYNACAAYDGEILRINDSTADSLGNLLLSADSCHYITNRVTDHKIFVDFPCRDIICDAQEVQNLAYYINRLRHGMQDLNTYIKAVVADFTTQFNAYKAAQEAKAAMHAPYIEADYAAYTSAGKSTLSFVVGIYDPNRSKLNLTLTALPTATNTSGSPIVGARIQQVDKSLYPDINPSSWTGWTQLYGKTTVKEKMADYSLSPSLVTDPTVASGVQYFTNRSIDCRDVVTLSSGFTLPTTNNTASSIEWRLRQEGSTMPSTAYKRCVILPNDIYFNVKSRRIYDEEAEAPYFRYQVTFELFTCLTTLANPILENKPTSLVVDLALPFNFIAGTAYRISNGVSTALIPSMKSGINPARLVLNAAQLTFPDRQVIQFEAKSETGLTADVSLAITANMALTNGGTTYYYPGPTGATRLTFTVD